MTRLGLVGSFRAEPHKGEALAELLLQAAESLAVNPDCELYVIGRSADEAEVVWVTEIWASREAHQASLSDPAVRDLITQARPLIAGFGERFELVPLGGKGLLPAE